ncbi:MAG: hypothetical protein CTY12_07885 [Methylotenera sp.]|nr:MAG: hypothetical protein CTY12_07885 [Methylotenera sp.]
MIYAGIGSRKLPNLVIDQMIRFGDLAAKLGWILRSGAAHGADAAFESGCDHYKGSKEIFLPWKGFNNHPSSLSNPTKDAQLLACEIHPRYDFLSRGAKSLVARNMHQILGSDLNTPVQFVVCWTPDGCESHETYCDTTGGTGSAIALASKNNIPVFNITSEARYQEAILYMLTITGETDG